MFGLDDERDQDVHSGQAEAVFKKCSNMKRFEPDGDEEQFNDEPQGFRIKPGQPISDR